LFVARCAPAPREGDPTDAAVNDATVNDATVNDSATALDSGSALDSASALDSGSADDSAMDGGLDARDEDSGRAADVAQDQRPSPSDAADAGDARDSGARVDSGATSDGAAPSCTGSATFACGRTRCTLFEVCARTGSAEQCYATTARDRCTPCSTQFISALPRDFCASGFRSYDGDAVMGCVVRCL
jgi:hypothetical protein